MGHMSKNESVPNHFTKPPEVIDRHTSVAAQTRNASTKYMDGPIGKIEDFFYWFLKIMEGLVGKREVPLRRMDTEIRNFDQIKQECLF